MAAVALNLLALVLVLGILLHGWLHGSEPETAAADEISPDDVAQLINEAIAPLQDRISEQAAELAALNGAQAQLASSIHRLTLGGNLAVDAGAKLSGVGAQELVTNGALRLVGTPASPAQLGDAGQDRHRSQQLRPHARHHLRSADADAAG